MAVTLWLVGFLVALVTGMLSAYLLVTVLFVGSKAYVRLRAVVEEREGEKLGPGR